MTSETPKRNRPTIGVLAGWSTLEGSTPDYYRMSVIKGIQSAARSRHCNLLLSWGIRRAEENRFHPAWPVVSPDVDFIPVGPWNTDGLIVLAPLGSEDRSRYVQNLIAEGHPTLFIATGEEGAQISVNNRAGIRQAMAHLVGHGHRRIAFIAGLPDDDGDSKTRLDAYRAAVTEFKLDKDPRLVVWGWHDFNQGYKSFWSLLTSEVKFTAVLASNDNAAIGAMRAMREANIRIPGDVAVMGFDDQPSAVAQVPPLSTVHVPLKLIGEQALIMMADHLTTQQIPLETVQISTRIVRRLSCGCIPEVVSSALNREALTQTPALQQLLKYATMEERQEQVVKEMLNVLPPTLRFPGEEETRRVCTALVAAFCKSLDEMTPIHFQAVFIDAINELEWFDRSLGPWQEMISVLRREMALLPFTWDTKEVLRLAEDMLHQARVIVGESAQRQDERHQYRRSIDSLALNALTAHLSAALSEEQIIKALDTQLEAVGIRHARIFFFEADQDDPISWSVILNPAGDSVPQRFPSRQFPPQELYSPDELLNIILLPLVFQGENLGYAAFDATNDLRACAVVAMQLAATIKVVRLHAEVVELSLTDALTGLHNRRYFELFLKNEVGRSRRFMRALAIVLVDVDHFKEYNDTYGHPAGDQALLKVAQCLSTGRRTADTVARIGGDEFVLILPETDLNGALEVCVKIRAMVAEVFGLKQSISVMSVSIGLTAPENVGVDSEKLIQQADTALYESKRNGRNRISAYWKGQVFDEDEIPLST